MWILFILILLFAYLYITANNNLKFVKPRDDLENIEQFDKYYRVGDVSKDISKKSTLFFRHLSCGIPGLADLTKNGNGMPNFMDYTYKKFVYGDKDNYKLKVIEPVE